MNHELLKKERKKRGLTQKDMAKKLGYSGKSGYSCLETGKVKVTVDTSLQIKQILNLSDEEYHSIFFKQQVR